MPRGRKAAETRKKGGPGTGERASMGWFLRVRKMSASPQGHRKKDRKSNGLERPLDTFHDVKLASCLPVFSHLHPRAVQGDGQREAGSRA